MSRLVIITLLLMPQLVIARTWYLKPDGTGDAPTIQAGLDLTSPGDTVILECGHYYEHSIDMRPGVCLRGESGDPDCAAIDGQSQMVIFACWGSDGDGAEIEGITFLNGLAPPGDVYMDGAGVQCLGCSPVFRNCLFVGNVAAASGGGMLCYESSARVVDCAFIDNFATKGGAIACYRADPFVERCLFSRNVARYTEGSRGMGGAVRCWESSPSFLCCTFFDNSAWEAGAAICALDGSFPVLERCIISSNRRSEAVDCADAASDVALDCCDMWGNFGDDWTGCIADQLGVNGNFSACPSFCDAEGGDLHLCDQSPCLPGNHPDGYDCGLIGAWGEGCSCGPTGTEPTTWGAIKSTYK